MAGEPLLDDKLREQARSYRQLRGKETRDTVARMVGAAGYGLAGHDAATSPFSAPKYGMSDAEVAVLREKLIDDMTKLRSAQVELAKAHGEDFKNKLEAYKALNDTIGKVASAYVSATGATEAQKIGMYDDIAKMTIDKNTFEQKGKLLENVEGDARALADRLSLALQTGGAIDPQTLATNLGDAMAKARSPGEFAALIDSAEAKLGLPRGALLSQVQAGASAGGGSVELQQIGHALARDSAVYAAMSAPGMSPSVTGIPVPDAESAAAAQAAADVRDAQVEGLKREMNRHGPISAERAIESAGKGVESIGGLGDAYGKLMGENPTGIGNSTDASGKPGPDPEGKALDAIEGELSGLKADHRSPAEKAKDDIIQSDDFKSWAKNQGYDLNDSDWVFRQYILAGRAADRESHRSNLAARRLGGRVTYGDTPEPDIKSAQDATTKPASPPASTEPKRVDLGDDTIYGAPPAEPRPSAGLVQRGQALSGRQELRNQAMYRGLTQPEQP